jgi:molybdopterin synthase sulfur carrier subunit
LILIKLLGGAKKAIGSPSIVFDKPIASVSEIFSFLLKNAVEPNLLKPSNILIAINGVESSTLSGNNTIVKTGDTITVVTVVHGGTLYG